METDKALRDRFTIVGIFGAYYVMLVAYLVASYFPEHRVWGFNWWAYYPDWVRWGLFGIGALVPVALRFIPQTEVNNSDHTEKADTNDRKFFIYVGAITTVFGGLFYMLRARTHFQGDGYQLLDLLANQAPTFGKFTEIGTAILYQWVWSMIGGDNQAAALLSYQIISITSGLLFVVVVALFARKLYDRTVERVLFLLGICTGGYMLLFFGYVENYSLFVLSVLTYTLTGFLIAEGKASRYWILPPVIAAVFFHVLGVTLLPSALYLWVGPTRLGRTIRTWRPLTKLVASGPIMVIVAVVFYHFYTTSYFFRFAFVPLFENRFTVEGYTLFSMNHLLDCLNLLFLLVPGLLIMIVALSGRSVRRALKQRPFIYLLVLTSSVLGALFIFDPKLGMPRDWDLFSFAGVPITLIGYYLVLGNWRSSPMRYSYARLILLSFLILVPRAVGGFHSSAGLNHYRSYLLLDIAKGRNGWIHLSNYYLDKGDTLLAVSSIADWKARNPEVVMIKTASRLLQVDNKILEAKAMGHDIIGIAPTYPDGYEVVGICDIYLGMYTEALAYLRIADGLCPDRSTTINNLGQTYQMLGEFELAKSNYLRSIILDTTDVAPVYNLARLYADQLRPALYEKYLSKAAAYKRTPAYVVKEWGDYMISKKQFPAAAEAYRRAMEKGLDTAYVQQLMEQYPDLRKLLE